MAIKKNGKYTQDNIQVFYTCPNPNCLTWELEKLFDLTVKVPDNEKEQNMSLLRLQRDFHLSNPETSAISKWVFWYTNVCMQMFICILIQCLKHKFVYWIMHTTIGWYTKMYAGGTMTIWMKNRIRIFWNSKIGFFDNQRSQLLKWQKPKSFLKDVQKGLIMCRYTNLLHLLLFWYQIGCFSVFLSQYCVDDHDALGSSGSTKHVNNIQERNKNRIRRRRASSLGRVRIWQLCQENRSFEGRHDSTKRNDFVHWSIHWLDTCGNVWQRISQADVYHLIEFREGVPHICWFQKSECILISISN